MADGLLVTFEWIPVHMSFQSEKEGRPIYEDREHVRIIPIGDNKTVAVREATDEDKARWPDEYARFKKGDTHQVIGTPLQEWPFMRPSQIKMLNFFNIFSVEDLSTLSDTTIQKIGPGGRDLVKQALAYLEKAKSTGPSVHLALENERLKQDMAVLQEQMKKLMADAEPRTKRGRVETIPEGVTP
jgi:hypothetical protein